MAHLPNHKEELLLLKVHPVLQITSGSALYASAFPTAYQVPTKGKKDQSVFKKARYLLEKAPFLFLKTIIFLRKLLLFLQNVFVFLEVHNFTLVRMSLYGRMRSLTHTYVKLHADVRVKACFPT